jgi:hypothetical protein
VKIPSISAPVYLRINSKIVATLNEKEINELNYALAQDQAKKDMYCNVGSLSDVRLNNRFTMQRFGFRLNI